MFAAVAFDVSVVWSFFAWLFAGLWASATCAWIVGDLTLLYWTRNFNYDTWMVSANFMRVFWLAAHVATVVAHWFVWKDHGGWKDEPAPLVIGIVYVLSTVVWHAIFYWMYAIRTAFWVSIVSAALALTVTIWFWLIELTPGVIMLFVLIWSFYVILWCLQLGRLNTKGGMPRRAPGMPCAPPLKMQAVDYGIPPEDMWKRVWRSHPFPMQLEKIIQRKRNNGMNCESVVVSSGGGDDLAMSPSSSSAYTSDGLMSRRAVDPSTNSEMIQSPMGVANTPSLVIGGGGGGSGGMMINNNNGIGAGVNMSPGAIGARAPLYANNAHVPNVAYRHTPHTNDVYAPRPMNVQDMYTTANRQYHSSSQGITGAMPTNNAKGVYNTTAVSQGVMKNNNMSQNYFNKPISSTNKNSPSSGGSREDEPFFQDIGHIMADDPYRATSSKSKR